MREPDFRKVPHSLHNRLSKDNGFLKFHGMVSSDVDNYDIYELDKLEKQYKAGKK